MDLKRKFDSKELLKPGNMLRLYASGAFPMADDSGKISWFMPEIRTIIPLDNYNIPRSLKKNITESNFKFKLDHDFPSVVKKCTERDSTWISGELIEAYLRL